MNKSLKNVWIKLLNKVINEGEHTEDYTELFNQSIYFDDISGIEDMFDDKKIIENISEMRKVFFSDSDNKFGHSYYSCAVGPFGNNGLGDIIELLKDNNNTKRAVLTFKPYGKGKVPCINFIHFLIRKNRLKINYFSRGQDIFNKFFCDAICIMDMAIEVSKELEIEVEGITANISSAHIYDIDLEDAKLLVGKYYE